MASLKLSRTSLLGPLIRFFFWEIPSILAPFAIPSKSRPLSPKRRLLILKLDAIGDFLLFLGALQEIRKIYSPDEWEITLLGNRVWRDLAVALDVADQYHFIDLLNFEINPLYRLKILSWVGAGGFEAAVQGVYSRSFYRDDFLVKICESPRRIGYYGDTHNSPQGWLMRGNKYYTDLIELQTAGPMHVLETHARLTATLGGSGSVTLPVLPTSEMPVLNAVSLLLDSYCVIVPGASALIKQWPTERFAGLAQFIHDRSGFQPVILGGVKDRKIASQVIEAIPSLPWVDLSGEISLMEALAIITNASLYVGNDTGLTHMATMARIPTVAVVGGGFPGRDFPYPEGIAPHLTTITNLPLCSGCGLRCNATVNGRAKCIHDISLEAVISRMQWL
jgi:ADP-heptose:LPS heptosyltransferase